MVGLHSRRAAPRAAVLVREAGQPAVVLVDLRCAALAGRRGATLTTHAIPSRATSYTEFPLRLGSKRLQSAFLSGRWGVIRRITTTGQEQRMSLAILQAYGCQSRRFLGASYSRSRKCIDERLEPQFSAVENRGPVAEQ